FITDASSQTVYAIVPVVTVGLTLSFITYGFLIMRGVVEMPITDFIGKIIKISIITSMAANCGFYQTQIADAINRTPDELINALVSNSTKKEGAATSIDNAADKGFSLASKAFEHSGFFVENGIVYCMIGIVILMTTSVFIALGGAILILTKLILTILLGIGPIFILALLWQSTSKFFEMWVAQIVNYIILGVLITMTFGLMLTIYSTYMGDMKFDGVQNVASALGGAVILSIAMIVVLLQIPNIAAALSGGMNLSYLQELKTIKNNRDFSLNNMSLKSNDKTRSDSESSFLDKNGANSNSQKNSIKGYYKGNLGRKSHENL
ncbi:MAG: type IV secretion system protein, partial [Rickettsiales bacterium]